MNLQVAVSELLYLHDCVIIPGFGGFVTRYQPATIHPTQHQFTAPCKAILFNRNLKTNDGLLADHISRTSGKTFSDAVSYIAKEVKEFESLLNKGKRIHLAAIGELYLDVEKSIQFSPDLSSNYLLESYGLSEFQSASIKRYDEQAKVIQLPTAVESVRKKSTLKRVLVAAVILPFVALMGYLPFHSDLANKSLSSLNPFAGGDNAKSVYTPRTHDVKEISLKDVAFNHSLPSVAHVIEAKHEATAAPVVTSEIAKVEVKKETSSSSYRFLLIAGCFQSESNAMKFINELSAKGLSASIAGQTPAGLFRVACGMYNERSEAVSAQKSLSQQNTSAWILAN